MAESIAPPRLHDWMVFPFRGPGWGQKALIAAALGFGGLIIPILPWIVLVGWVAELIRRVVEDGMPALPEWNDWGGYAVQGLRVSGVILVYLLPPILLFFAAYAGMLAPSIYAGEIGRGGEWLAVSGILVMFLLMGAGVLLGIAATLVLPAAVAHTAVTGRFSAGFQIGEWWPILRSGLGGFLLAFLLLNGFYTLSTLVVSVSIFTVILCVALPITVTLLYVYGMLVTGAVTAQAYREGLEKLGRERVTKEVS